MSIRHGAHSAPVALLLPRASLNNIYCYALNSNLSHRRCCEACSVLTCERLQARTKHPQGTEIKAITYSAMQVVLALQPGIFPFALHANPLNKCPSLLLTPPPFSRTRSSLQTLVTSESAIADQHQGV